MDPPSDVRPGASDAPAEPASRYEVLARIARGGMASVFVGRLRGAVGFSRLVAIKRPHAFVYEDPALCDSFVREARVASAIHHPHVVSVLDVDLQGGEVSLILDYVEGCALSDLVAHARRVSTSLPTGVALRIILDAASGLHAAHTLCDGGGRSLGIVHRDVSPQNILVGLDGHARLTDFGIAKITTDMYETATNVLKGKFGYMAPEYVERNAFDARSDEYALAVVAWEALTGARLFHAESEAEALQRVLNERARPPSATRADLAPFDDIFARALARDPRERFDSVWAFANVLEERARPLGCVATHDEVARTVEAAVGDRLRDRRGTIEELALGQSAPARDSRPRSPRDEMPTLSLHGVRADLSPPSLATHATTISLPTTARRVREQPPPRRPLVAVGAACVIGVIAALILRWGLTRNGEDVGLRQTLSPAPSTALPPSASVPESAPSPGAPPDPTQARSTPGDAIPSTAAESLPVGSPSTSVPPRRAPPRKPTSPARPGGSARPSGGLFPDPG
jgi:serine/threonine-protein kinase